MQLLESPIPPLTASAFPMIICKRPAPHFDNHEKGLNMHFWRPVVESILAHQPKFDISETMSFQGK